MFSYKLARDFGFAPNPFHGICTLATCKPQIRATAELGDLVIGCGSAANNLAGRMIYVMRVQGSCSFQEYWDDERFAIKKPVFTGSQSRAYGDNIYSKDANGEWLQRDSHHSFEGGVLNESNRNRDTGADVVLWSRDFAYWGHSAPPIPALFRNFDGDDLYPAGRNYRVKFDPAFVQAVDDWFRAMPDRGCKGRPEAWR